MTSPAALPHIQAEKDLLGKILIHYDTGMIDQASAILDVGDFELPHHQLIFQAMINCSGEGHTLELANVFGEIVKLPNGNEVTTHRLGLFTTECADGSSIHYLCGLIKRHSNHRRIGEYRHWLEGALAGGNEDPSELAAQAEARLLQITDAMQASNEDARATTVREMAAARVRLQGGRNVQHDLHTGFCDLDRTIGGFGNGTLIVLGARASVGKTSLMMDFAISALRQDKKCMIVSIEMVIQEFTERMICSYGRLPYHELRTSGRVAPEMSQRISGSEEFFRGTTYEVHAESSVSVDQIAAKARLFSRRHDGLDLLCIDYLQLIRSTDRRIPRHEQVADMSRKLSALAKSLNVPILVLCQLNRATMEERGSLPKLHNLRESGAIEQDADMVLLLHRKGLHDRGQETSQADRNEAQLLIAKNRSGPTGVVPLTFLAQSCSFADASRQVHEASDESAPNLPDHFTDQDPGT